MTTFEYTDDLSVCVDCLFLLANGGDSVEPSWCPDNEGLRPYDYTCDGTCEAAAEAHVAAVDRNWEGWDLVLGSNDCEWCGTEAREADDFNGDSCEPWFSWSACHGCGSKLGGNREHAIGMRETTITEDGK